MNNEDEKIDFVITWVDGNDEKWIEEKEKYSTKKISLSNSANRYREWGNLRYWFRGIEKYTPWINKIYFITWGHIPEWLNTENPKLQVVRHDQYIPKEYLPTFSSRVIELNIHRIKDLSDKFVLFNDDMFILKKMKKKDFFYNELPLDIAIQNANISEGKGDVFPHTILNNIDILNKHFNKRNMMKKNLLKWFNIKYGSEMIRNICLLPWSHITGMWDMHIPHSYIKKNFEEVWNAEYDILDNTCRHKFRDITDVNHFLIADWQICKGEFKPRSYKFGKRIEITDNYEEIYNTVIKQKYKIVCLNDSEPNIDFEKSKQNIISAFDKILPEKSSFEV